jgi:hypothetical protein
MPYTHFRYIAYEVPTATFPADGSGGVVCDYAPGAECAAIARVPVPPGLVDDARIRVKRFAAVADQAATELQNLGGDNANTLKILMAPEFYFRPVNAGFVSGTYPHSDLKAIVEALAEMFLDAAFADWLIVPGTILWNTKADEEKSAPLYFNTLVHVRGGAENTLHVIEKNHPSGIDGMPQVGIPARDANYRIFHQRWRNRKAHVHSIEGTPLGFEICLDHAKGAACRILRKVLTDWPNNENGAAQPASLHLLSAGGMGIQAESVSARPNGFILRNDGLANPGARSELQKVVKYKRLWGLLSGGDPVPLLSATAQLANVASASTLNLQNVVGMPALAVPQKPGFATFVQRLVFYPPRPIVQ